MKRVIDTSEVLGALDRPEGPCELCASAVATHDEDAGRLIVKLEAFVRSAGPLAKERRFSVEWLPKPETVAESVGAEEATAVARDVFQRWTRKVRQAAPALHSPTL